MLSYIKSRRSCTLEELMEHFNVSSATIHRDAAALSRRDAIERVRGGLLYRDAPDPAAGAADRRFLIDDRVHPIVSPQIGNRLTADQESLATKE